MIVKVLNEAGYEEAMLGLSLNHNQPVENSPKVARKLYNKDHGHNKFLESIIAWLDIFAPRYWWQQFDTYRVGITKQSQSTMHTLMKQPLQQKNFEGGIYPETLERLNYLLEKKEFNQLKRELPESFIQRRVVCANYQGLRRIIIQRHNHKLSEWPIFCNALLEELKYQDLIVDLKGFSSSNKANSAAAKKRRG